VFWRRSEPVPELPLDRNDVNAIFDALWDIKGISEKILAILSDEEDDDES